MLRVWCNDTLNDFVALRCTPACLVPCFEITVLLAGFFFVSARLIPFHPNHLFGLPPAR